MPRPRTPNVQHALDARFIHSRSRESFDPRRGREWSVIILPTNLPRSTQTIRQYYVVQPSFNPRAITRISLMTITIADYLKINDWTRIFVRFPAGYIPLESFSPCRNYTVKSIRRIEIPIITKLKIITITHLYIASYNRVILFRYRTFVNFTAISFYTYLLICLLIHVIRNFCMESPGSFAISGHARPIRSNLRVPQERGRRCPTCVEHLRRQRPPLRAERKYFRLGTRLGATRDETFRLFALGFTSQRD